MIDAGQAAPDFTLDNHRGERVTLSSLAGSPVVLWFYPKADTPGCTLEGKGFRDAIEAFRERGVKVFGISFDDVAANAAFVEKFDFPFDLLCDTEREVGLAYGACDGPDDRYARRVSYLIAPDGAVWQAYPKVTPSNHAQQLLEDIDFLRSEQGG